MHYIDTFFNFYSHLPIIGSGVGISYSIIQGILSL